VGAKFIDGHIETTVLAQKSQVGQESLDCVLGKALPKHMVVESANGGTE
jgi:hypothetical protein